MTRELELLMELERELSKLSALEAKAELEALDDALGLPHDAPAIAPAGASLTLNVHVSSDNHIPYLVDSYRGYNPDNRRCKCVGVLY